MSNDQNNRKINVINRQKIDRFLSRVQSSRCKVVEGAALLLSDLGIARADRSAAWFRGELAKPRSAMARSVSLCAPPFASWNWPSLSSVSSPPSLSLEYPGPNAVRPAPRYFITTTTRRSLTLPPGTSRSSCPRSLKPAEDKDRASRSGRGASLCSSTDADGMPPCSNEWP